VNIILIQRHHDTINVILHDDFKTRKKSGSRHPFIVRIRIASAGNTRLDNLFQLAIAHRLSLTASAFSGV
jgi:hypothetical protein